MINRLKALKLKMENAEKEEEKQQAQTRRRIEHLDDLYKIESLIDVKYEQWSKVRLNRLLVDYLLRSGYMKTARKLAEEKQIEDLVDIEVFEACHKIEESLKNGSTMEALAWCREQVAVMKKAGVR